MPRHCPICGDIAEKNCYVVPSGGSTIIGTNVGQIDRGIPAGIKNLEVYECNECGWAEDVL